MLNEENVLSEERQRQKRKAAVLKHLNILLFLAPFAVVFSIFFLYPLGYGIYVSFFKWNIYNPSVNEFVGFENYFKILFDSENIYHQYFMEGMWNTFLFVLMSVPCMLIVPFALAYLINMKPFGWKVFKCIFFAPGVISIAAVGIIFTELFNTDYGLINNVFDLEIQWTNHQPYAWIVILLCTVWWSIGSNLVIFHAALAEVDKTVYEAASLDGCVGLKKIWYITLPSIKNQFMVVLMTTVIGSFGLYGQSYLITKGGPDDTTQTVIMRIQAAASKPGFTGMVSAMAICLGIVIIICTVIQHFATKDHGDSVSRHSRAKAAKGEVKA